MDFRKTEMEKPENSVGQKRRGRPPKPTGPDTLISLRVDDDLMCALEYGATITPRLQAGRDAYVYYSEGIGSREGAGGGLQIRPLRQGVTGR